MRAVLAMLVAALAAVPAHALSLLQFLDAGTLFTPYSVATSPDGESVYVGEATALFVFSRDSATGQLAFREIAPASLGRISGSVLPSPDGRHVYARQDAELAIYATDPDTGRLQLLQTMAFPETPGSLGASSDGALLAVAGSTFAGSEGSVHLFARDAGSGLLTLLDTLTPAEVDDPTAIAFSPDGAHLAVMDLADTVFVFAADPLTGFTPLQSLPAPPYPGVHSGADVAFSGDGANLYVVDRGRMRVFQRDLQTGLLSPGADDLPGATGLVPSPDGAHLYTSGGGVDAYARDPQDGSLSFLFTADEPDPLFYGGSQQAAITPDDAHLYVAAWQDDTLQVLARDAGTGALAGVQRVAGYFGGIATLHLARSVIVSDDGRHVYVGARGCSDVEECSFASVTVLTRNGAGRLELVEAHFLGDGWAGSTEEVRGLALSPDGAQLYAAAHGDDVGVTVYTRHADTGKLEFLETHASDFSGPPGLYGAKGIAVAPDGSAAYVAGEYDDAVAVFARDADTGALTYQTSLVDGQDGVEGLDGASALAIDPAGAHLYAAGREDGAVAIFTIEPGTGALDFLEAKDLGAYHGPGDLVVSTDGASLYVVGEMGGAQLTTFARDPTTGALTWMSNRALPDFGSSASVVAAGDGRAVYVGRDRVHRFVRDPATGAVQFVERVAHEAHGLAISPDGRHLYGTSNQGLSVLVPAPGAGALGTGALAALGAPLLARRRYARRSSRAA